ncbi:aspartate racemase [Paucilactobacillus oligofermentans DSM 15707 = LMG 22743]|uniref:Aspartate racemase n=1 Tax=Paucilactobacillus oligofermentans DSM 15707 = LMG 22743 TaxID=1423778 RepID=A0A0R1RFM2_9LACO|nr:amino acid racemase [Paucilactobacillus oligofermentans]KRL55711.1 aspartate racemase [Paucilactobacillus oligofermentans DSM 15707 = LMG 22743]CUS27073.1 Aspartate racemase [Paucilactobacillus oligofermentans DSM 15707 = LMG 22743]
MNHFFTILGGMGSLATESFVRLLNERTPTNRDQDYLDYIVVNHASIPDRSAYILDHTKADPTSKLVDDVKQFSQLQPAFFVLTCNSAHYFYDKMQANTSIPILHMPKLTVEAIAKINPTAQRVGILGTPGTLTTGIYDQFLTTHNYEVVHPTTKILAETNKLIFDDIKGDGIVNHDRYHHILQQMHDELQVDITILGCTELSLAQEKAPDHNFLVADAQSILVDNTIKRALNK